MGRGAAPTARKARGGRATGAATWRGGTRRPRTVLPVATPLLSLPGARLPRCPGRASGRFSGRGRGGRGARRSGEAAGRGWKPCAALPRPFLPASPRGLLVPRPGDSPWRSRRCPLPAPSVQGKRGVSDRPARESGGSRDSAARAGWLLLQPPSFRPFLSRENKSGNSTEVGSIEHLLNPTLSSFRLSFHLSNWTN